MNIKVENLIVIFTILDGDIKIIVKDNNLFKINCDDTLDVVNKKFIEKDLKIKNLNLKQCYAFSNKNSNGLIISILYIDIINYDDIKDIKSLSLVSIKDIEHNIYIDSAIEYLKKELIHSRTIKKIYTGEFVLPEIQKLYEFVFNKKYDRRNFRKKLIKSNMIESVEKTFINKTGRPAKIYKFSNIEKDRIIL